MTPVIKREPSERTERALMRAAVGAPVIVTDERVPRWWLQAIDHSDRWRGCAARLSS